MRALIDQPERGTANAAVLSPKQPVTIEVASSLNEFIVLRPSWNDLVSHSSHDSIFLRHEWFTAWWRVYGRGRKLHILLARHGSQLVGIAPLMRCTKRLRFLPLIACNQIRFIENGEAMHVDFIIRNGCDEVPAAFMHHLNSIRNSWTMVYLRKVRQSSPLVAMAGQSPGGLTVKCKEAMRSPVLTVQGDWQNFYQSRSKTCRKRIRLTANRIQTLGQVKLSKVTDIAAWQEAMPKLWQIGDTSSKRHFDWSIGRSHPTRDFLSELAKTAARQNWLNVWLLSVDGKPLAFEYHLRYKNELFALRAEYDRNYEDYSPGFALDSHIVERCFSDGISRYNMGGSDNFYKLRWTNDCEPHMALFIYNRNLLSRIMCAIEFRLLPLLSRLSTLRSLRQRLGKFSQRLRSAYAEHGPLGLIPAAAARAANIAFGANQAWWFARDLTEKIEPAEAHLPLTFQHNNACATIKWMRTLQKPSVVHPAELEVARAEGHYLVNVRHEGKIIGYVKVGFGRVYIQDYGRVVSFRPHEAFIYDTFVLPEYRRKKVASAAIAYCLKLLADKGYLKLYCHIPPWNVASITAYRRAGFQQLRKIRYRRILGIGLLTRTNLFALEKCR